ncbi:hypothetical protein Tco_0222713 [Tanacetum coccineum]
MADNRTMAQMLQAPIEGYEDAIVIPPINANNFELKQPLINLVQSNKFTGRQDPHNHLRFFNKVTSTFRHPEVPNTSVKLLLFPFSLDGEARDWLEVKRTPDQFSHGTTSVFSRGQDDYQDEPKDVSNGKVLVVILLHPTKQLRKPATSKFRNFPSQTLVAKKQSRSLREIVNHNCGNAECFRTFYHETKVPGEARRSEKISDPIRDIAFLDNLHSDDDISYLASKVTSDNEPEQLNLQLPFSPRTAYEIYQLPGKCFIKNSVIESLPIFLSREDSEPNKKRILPTNSLKYLVSG